LRRVGTNLRSSKFSPLIYWAEPNVVRVSTPSRGAQELQWSVKQLIERRLLEDLLKQGLSTPKIAARLGFSQSGVRYWEAMYGLKTAFGPHGKGRRVKSPKQRAADTVREVTAQRRRLKSRAIAYKGGKCILCGYDGCNAALSFTISTRQPRPSVSRERG
jgi:hypothetical protein